MGVAGGPKISKDGLVFAIDSDSNVRGFTKYGTSGTNNNHRAIRNLVDRSSTFSTANTSQLTGGVTYYTLYGITYPEGSYSPANRDGITPGFENISATKTYGASRDVNYYVFDEDTNTWVADSYFNGLRVNGHCYDTYSSTVRAAEHAAFQADYDNIKTVFPNATHIVIGSHASENVDNDANTVTRLKEIGFPDDAVGLGRVEFVLVGKVNKPWTHHYVRENVSSAVANMVIGLPLEGKGGALTFDGTDDILDTGLFSGRNPSTDPFTVEAILKSNTTSGNKMWVDATGNGSNQRFYSALDDDGSNPIGIQGAAWSDPIPSTTNYIHQTIVMDGSTARSYRNGSASYTRSYTSYTLPGSLKIGGRSGYNWNGEIPVFKLYDRALSADEVQQNYNAYKNRFNL